MLDLQPSCDVLFEHFAGQIEQVAHTSAASELCIAFGAPDHAHTTQTCKRIDTQRCRFMSAHGQYTGYTLFGVMPSARGV